MEDSLCPYNELGPWYGLSPALVISLSPPNSIIEAAGGFLVGLLGPRFGFLSVLSAMVWLVYNNKSLNFVEILIAWTGLSGVMWTVLDSWTHTTSNFDLTFHSVAEKVVGVLTLPLEAMLLLAWLAILFAGCPLFSEILDVYTAGAVYVAWQEDLRTGVLLWVIGSFVLDVFEHFDPSFPTVWGRLSN